MKRRTSIWAAVYAAAGLALAAIPLFDLLAYEACFALGLLTAFTGAHLGSFSVAAARAGAARSERERADARPVRELARRWLAATARVWALATIPLGILLANAFRVRNCDLAGGLAWFALLPMASAAVGAATGMLTALTFARPARATAIAMVVVIASIAWSVWRFYAAPPIFAFDPFGGYFPGTLYDEEVAIGAPLLWARFYHFSCVLAALLVASAFFDGIRFSLAPGRLRPKVLLVALIFVAHAIGFHASLAKHGVAYSAEDIVRALGATRETEHFRLHYSPAGPWAKDIDATVADHEFRWQQLRKLLGVEPSGKVDSFLFDSPAQKQALMGAGHTSVAKPWRREIYLQHEGWPHPVVAHELAHVFAGRFGDPIFGVARRGLRFNVGLIEGVAVAAAWQKTPLSPDELVKAMRTLGLEPPLERVMSLDFLGLNAAQAYNVAGSFCRFLLDGYGPEKLGALFGAAGAPESWTRIYGVSFEALRARWSARIDAIALAPVEAERVRDRLRRPSIFHKVCAHRLALEREAAHRAQAAGDRAGALRKLEEVCAEDADDPSGLVEVMDAAEAANRPSDSAVAAGRLRKHPKASGAQKGRAEAQLGDLNLRRGNLDEARAHYQAARGAPLDEANARLVAAKLIALDEPPGPIADKLRRFLAAPSADRDVAIDLLTLGELVHADPDRGLFHYLLGRQLESRSRWPEAIDALSKALNAKRPLGDERFVREAQRLLGRALFRGGRLDEARAIFVQLGDTDFVERCDWAKGQR
jgi:tetratricopeptide (TPR) repeat protein